MKKLINPALMKAFFESAKLFSWHSIRLRKRKYGLRNAENQCEQEVERLKLTFYLDLNQ
jgi:hypothetical protein